MKMLPVVKLISDDVTLDIHCHTHQFTIIKFGLLPIVLVISVYKTTEQVPSLFFLRGALALTYHLEHITLWARLMLPSEIRAHQD